jgi:hypothetical protein
MDWNGVKADQEKACRRNESCPNLHTIIDFLQSFSFCYFRRSAGLPYSLRLRILPTAGFQTESRSLFKKKAGHGVGAEPILSLLHLNDKLFCNLFMTVNTKKRNMYV